LKDGYANISELAGFAGISHKGVNGDPGLSEVPGHCSPLGSGGAADEDGISHGELVKILECLERKQG
jgi:hypothetical protein